MYGWATSSSTDGPRVIALALLTFWWTAAGAGPIEAQLRPLEPLDWGFWDTGASAALTLGSAFYSGQRASLAGTEGRLIELGTLTASVVLGRVVLQVHGTMARLYDERHVFAEPAGGARAPDGSRRIDTGDHQIHTIVRLTDHLAPYAAALRFGVRLPTTDNAVGLDRDQTDFFALLAGRALTGPVAVWGELGVGVYGTREVRPEQVDPMLYEVGLRLERSRLTPVVQLVGQWDTRPGTQLRGVEDQTELRAGLQWGRSRAVRVMSIWGLNGFSPEYGLRLTLSALF